MQSLNTVHELNNIEKKKSQRSRDLNPRLLGEKRKHYLCAMPPPHFLMGVSWTLFALFSSSLHIVISIEKFTEVNDDEKQGRRLKQDSVGSFI